MEFQNIAFWQGDDARKWLRKLEKTSSYHIVAKELVMMVLGFIDPEEPVSQCPWGTGDEIYIYGDYILSWNFKMDYVGLCKFSGLEIKEEDISCTYGYHSYMLSYKSTDIGGASSDKSVKKLHSNLDYYKNQGKITKRDILNGRIAPYMFKAIIEIECRLTENKK